METSKAGRKLHTWRTPRILLPAAAASVLLLLVVGLWLGYGTVHLSTNPYTIAVDNVTLGSNGQVTFQLASSTNVVFRISTVNTYSSTF